MTDDGQNRINAKGSLSGANPEDRNKIYVLVEP